MTADWQWELWNHAISPLRSNDSAATAAFGKPFFDWVHDDRPDAGAVFDAAMRSLSSVAGPLVVRAVDLTGVASICDVGGGTGQLLRGRGSFARCCRVDSQDRAETRPRNDITESRRRKRPTRHRTTSTCVVRQHVTRGPSTQARVAHPAPVPCTAHSPRRNRLREPGC